MLLRLMLLGLLTVGWPLLSVADDAPSEPPVAGSEDGVETEPELPHDHDDHGHEDHGHGDHGDAHGEDHAEATPDPLAFDPDLAIFTLIVFGLLAAILRFTAWGPIVEGLAAREKGITDNIAEAANKHEEAKALLAQHEAKLAAAADDVRGMLEEARRDAETTKSQIVAEAQAAAEAERERAVREIGQARDSAVKNLAEQSANLSIDLAAKVVKQEITPERQGEIVTEALRRMASPSSN